MLVIICTTLVQRDLLNDSSLSAVLFIHWEIHRNQRLCHLISTKDSNVSDMRIFLISFPHFHFNDMLAIIFTTLLILPLFTIPTPKHLRHSLVKHPLLPKTPRTLFSGIGSFNSTLPLWLTLSLTYYENEAVLQSLYSFTIIQVNLWKLQHILKLSLVAFSYSEQYNYRSYFNQKQLVSGFLQNQRTIHNQMILLHLLHA